MDGWSNPEIRIGTSVAEKYELVRVLGSGGMGAVYEAVHQFTSRRVALKLMHARFAASPEAAARFLREAQAPSSIGHSALVDVLDAGQEDDGALYMALELLQGEDLSSAMRSGRCDVALLLEVARQLLDALAAAHEKGFVHRDIKPANVFLTRDGHGALRVRLLDFGIARKASRSITEGLTAAGSVLGTPDYMSPEQARATNVDGRADLWALGAVLFHALVGRPPFDGATVHELIAAICTERAPSLREFRSDLPEPLIELVDRALREDVRERWQSAREMAATVEKARAALGPGAPARVVAAASLTAMTTVVRPAPPPPPRSRALSVVLLALLAIALGAGAAYLLPWAPRRPSAARPASPAPAAPSTPLLLAPPTPAPPLAASPTPPAAPPAPAPDPDPVAASPLLLADAGPAPQSSSSPASPASAATAPDAGTADMTFAPNETSSPRGRARAHHRHSHHTALPQPVQPQPLPAPQIVRAFR